MAYATVARLHSEAALTADAAVALDEAQTHYLRNVLRLGPGARVALFNGGDGEWWGEIENLGRQSGTVRLTERRRAPRPEPDLWLVFAPLKRARIDFLIEKATELGVSTLVPAMTERTVVERLNLDRLRAHAREAAEQTERLTVPALREPVPLRGLRAEWPAERRLLACIESGAAPVAGADTWHWIILNKTDLLAPEVVQRFVSKFAKAAGVNPLLTISASSGAGVD